MLYLFFINCMHWKILKIVQVDHYISEVFSIADILNPYLTNGFSHHYQLGGSTFIFRGVRCIFFFLFFYLIFSMKFL